MDELAVMFASNLNLREGCNTENGRKASAGRRRPWFAPMVTIPSPAPHPALIRALPDGSTVPLVPRSNEIVYTSFGSANAVPATPLPSVRSRKVTPLPRRTRPNTGAFDSTLPSSPSFQFSDSRTSSFSSATLSQSRSSSSTFSSTDDLIDPLLPPAILVNELHLNEEQLKTLTEFIAVGIHHPPNDLIPHHRDFSNGGMMAKDISQYTRGSLATVSSSFIVAQS